MCILFTALGKLYRNFGVALLNYEYIYVKRLVFYTNGLFSFSNDRIYGDEKATFVMYQIIVKK